MLEHKEKIEIFDRLFAEHFNLAYQVHYETESISRLYSGVSSTKRNMYEIMESFGKDNPYVSKDGYVKEADEYNLDEGIFGAMIIYVALGDLRGNLPHLLAKLNWTSNFNEEIIAIYSKYGNKGR